MRICYTYFDLNGKNVLTAKGMKKNDPRRSAVRSFCPAQKEFFYV